MVVFDVSIRSDTIGNFIGLDIHSVVVIYEMYFIWFTFVSMFFLLLCYVKNIILMLYLVFYVF